MQIVSRSSSQDSFKNRDYDCYRLFYTYISICINFDQLISIVIQFLSTSKNTLRLYYIRPRIFFVFSRYVKLH